MPRTRARYLLFSLLASVVSLAACAGSEAAAQPTPTASAPAADSTLATQPPAPAPTATSRAKPSTGPLNLRISVAPDFTLPNANGSDITLSALSSQQPVVLVFYRAFW